ncbi:MAG TPA: diaminopimelate decarboxylase [Candidatus Omnitrophota bacterium]|nr:diaminopimelate decarboxylase [Candidatus Omnitrophota bacterium]HPS37246.1 diaminopimelate decarboxylase [Candidatus Omnitrophota bacterium]
MSHIDFSEEKMHEFYYKNGELYCEKVRVGKIAKQCGTPAYIYSYKTFTNHLAKLQKAFRAAKPMICYSVKANSNLAVLRALVKKGAGLDIVSGGELFRAKKVKCQGKKIVYAGVGKTEVEIRDAIRARILLFNAESLPELEMINAVAKKMRKKVNVSLRINPNVDPHTHDYITTGKAETKFGIDFENARAIFADSKRLSNLVLSGIHVHIGSQIETGDPFVEAFKKILEFIDELEMAGAKIRFLNLGGGLGAIYSDENPQTAEEFAEKILPLFKKRKFQLIFEPGRFVAANSGILLTRVIYVKETNVKHFAIVDAGMNDLIRPAFYNAHHNLWPVLKRENGAHWVYDVVGPICESGDFFAKDRELEEVRSGDLLALMTAGAYGFTMSSNYNSRPRACEVMVKGAGFKVVRKRETCQDLIRGERV